MRIKITKVGYFAVAAMLFSTLFITRPSSAITFTNLTRIVGVNIEVYGMSNDSRYYVLQSTNYLLAPNGVPGQTSVYIYDQTLNSFQRISVPNSGGQANGDSYKPSMTPDGRFIVFYSYASNLVSGDTNGVPDVFLYDRTTNQLSIESRSTSGAQGNKLSRDPQISEDGEYLVFVSKATNFDSRIPTNNDNDQVYIRSLIARSTTLASVSGLGNPGYQYSNRPRISGDNEYIVYSSNSSNLLQTTSTPTITVNTGLYNAYRYSTRRGTTEMVSRDMAGGVVSNATVNVDAVSRDGHYVTFSSTASNLVSNFTANGKSQVYGRDMGTGVTELITKNWQGDAMGNNAAGSSVIDRTGRYVAYTSAATNLIENDIYHFDSPNAYRLFLYDLVTGTTKMAAIPQDGLPSPNPLINESEGAPIMRLSGGKLAFSTMQRLLPGDTDNGRDVYTLEFGE